MFNAGRIAADSLLKLLLLFEDAAGTPLMPTADIEGPWGRPSSPDGSGGSFFRGMALIMLGFESGAEEGGALPCSPSGFMVDDESLLH